MNKIKIVVSRPQRLYIQSLKRVNGIVGGVGSGKTRATILKALRLFEYRSRQGIRGQIAIVEPTYSMIQDIILPDTLEILKKYNMQFNHIKRRVMLELPFADLYLRSGDRVQSLRGLNLSDVFFDEIDSYSIPHARELYKEGLARIRKTSDATINLSGTPEGKKFLYELFNDIVPFSEDYEDKYFVKCKTTDNPWIPPEFVESLRRLYDPKLFDMYCNGQFVDLEANKVYYAFKKEKNIIDFNMDDIHKKYPILVSYDFNVSPFCIVLAQMAVDGSHVVQFAEVREDRSNTREATNKVCRMLNRFHSYNIHIKGDSSGNSRNTKSAKIGETDYDIIMQVFKENRFCKVSKRVARSNPPVKDRLNAMNSALENKKVLIHKDCKHTIDDLDEVAYKNNEIYKGDLTKTHLSDALGYIVCEQFPVNRERLTNFVGNYKKGIQTLSDHSMHSFIRSPGFVS